MCGLPICSGGCRAISLAIPRRSPNCRLPGAGSRARGRCTGRCASFPPASTPASWRGRIRAFHDDFRGIPLTVSVHGIRFQLATTATQMPEAPQVVSPPLAAAS